MALPDPWPRTEPFATGMLDVGDGHRLYYEESGNPAGTPAVFLHGGPGSGSAAWQRSLIDPERCAWEDTHVRTFPGAAHDPRYDDPELRLRLARLVTHYWANAAFLPDGQLIRDLPRLAGIPGVLVHGRLDISSPPDIAWQLARGWPDADLVLVDDAGHGGGSWVGELRRGIDRF